MIIISLQMVPKLPKITTVIRMTSGSQLPSSIDIIVTLVDSSNGADLSHPNDRNDTIDHYFSDSRATKDGSGDEGHISIGFNQRDALTQPNLTARPTILKAFVFESQRFSKIIGFGDADGWQLSVHLSCK